MKKVFLRVLVLIFLGIVYVGCTPPEAINNEDETEVFTVDPANEGKVDDEPEEEPVQD